MKYRFTPTAVLKDGGKSYAAGRLEDELSRENAVIVVTDESFVWEPDTAYTIRPNKYLCQRNHEKSTLLVYLKEIPEQVVTV